MVWVGPLLGLLAVAVGIARLRPAAPSIDRATLGIDTVRRGEMKREVHAPGNLVPEHVRIIAAATAGRVETLPLRPGAAVTPATTIAQLSNTDVELQALQSEQQLTAAMSALAGLESSLHQQLLAQEGALAQMNTQYEEAVRSAAVFDSLDRKGLASPNEVAGARDRARELRTRLAIERQRLAQLKSAETEQLALMRDQIARLRAIVEAQRRRVQSMHVTAGEAGQLQVLPLELGQWVNPGMELARVAQPGRLKAVLRVPETEARDIAIGQRATIDTRNGLVAGHVMRTDPSAQAGTVTVEVALDGPLPPNTRSDLSVDGTIEIERLPNVLYVGRPSYGQPQSTVGLFKVDPRGAEATRVDVRLGRASATTVEVLGGLSAGDRVITSDMSTWDNLPRVRLK